MQQACFFTAKEVLKGEFHMPIERFVGLHANLEKALQNLTQILSDLSPFEAEIHCSASKRCSRLPRIGCMAPEQQTTYV